MNEASPRSEAPPHPSVLCRRAGGGEAAELFLQARPRGSRGTPAMESAVAALYRALFERLRAEGAGPEHAVREWVFFRDVGKDGDAFRAARERVLADLGAEGTFEPAVVHVGQAPVGAAGREGLPFEILLEVLVAAAGGRFAAWERSIALPCACRACGEGRARVAVAGGEKHIHAGQIFGAPGSACGEALSMFEAAAELLRQEGCDFRSVVRTWIYLRSMDEDYAEFNRARRAFFEKAGVSVPPASTGIQGVPFPEGHRYTLALHAIQSPRPLRVAPMTTPLLNEAPEYGSDFSRGMRVEEAHGVRLYVSGTASVDGGGRTVYPGDFAAQANRMLANVSSLLACQGASFRDVVAATSYLKRPADALELEKIYRRWGFTGFPDPLVEAPVCRPDLLCEVEAVALLPRGD